MDNNGLATPVEVAVYLGRSVATIQQGRHRGYGPEGFKPGGVVMWRRTAAVEKFLKVRKGVEAGA